MRIWKYDFKFIRATDNDDTWNVIHANRNIIVVHFGRVSYKDNQGVDVTAYIAGSFLMEVRRV